MIALIALAFKILGEIVSEAAIALGRKIAARFRKRKVALDDILGYPPERIVHFLVSPYEKDSRAYARLHKYDWKDCAHVCSEPSLSQARGRPGKIKIHYLRGWESLDQGTLARLRYLVNRT